MGAAENDGVCPFFGHRQQRALQDETGLSGREISIFDRFYQTGAGVRQYLNIFREAFDKCVIQLSLEGRRCG